MGDAGHVRSVCERTLILHRVALTRARRGREFDRQGRLVVMKLIAARIREFKSVWDSNEFKIDDITCLVGKNEAGKTGVLQALYRLNPIIESHTFFDVTDDYPRSEV